MIVRIAEQKIVGKGAKHVASWKCKPTSMIDTAELPKGYGCQAGMVRDTVVSKKSLGVRVVGFWVACPDGHGKVELDACLAICTSKPKCDITKCRKIAYWSNVQK